MKQRFLCVVVSCPGASSTELVRYIKEREGTESLRDPLVSVGQIPQRTDACTIMGNSEAGSKDYCLAAQGFSNVKGKITGTEKKMKIPLCAYQELLKI